MEKKDLVEIKKIIDEVQVVSFDVFDTLLFRKVNEPEIIFDIVGDDFGIHGFRSLRKRAQNEISEKLNQKYGYPHANLDEIYQYLRENESVDVDWDLVKAHEIQVEKDSLVANEEMREVMDYAYSKGKRIVATTDMYLSAQTIGDFLVANGFQAITDIYCSADERAAKFNKELFRVVSEKENIPYKKILHVGDNPRDDGAYPSEFGINTYIYRKNDINSKYKDIYCGDLDNGLYKILQKDNSFWYNLGLEAGGPIYMGLYIWLKEKLDKCNKKIYFLSRDGYTLYNLFIELGYKNVEYLHISRRSLLLASICSMTKRDIDLLPPYTYGQTIREVLDYLKIDLNDVTCLEELGFSGFDDVITPENLYDFKKIYIKHKEVFLKRCELERRYALQYFENVGFFEDDVCCFDCGWQGSSQELLESFKEAIGKNNSIEFYYFGIKNSEKSIKQLRGLKYDTFLFDYYKNYLLQTEVNSAVAVYELFFSAPHPSVYCYDKGGAVLFEKTENEPYKESITEGIIDFVKKGIEFVTKYRINYIADNCLGHIKRLINDPTEEEARFIGDICEVDGFVKKAGEKKYLAYITENQLENNPDTEVYWLKGLITRNDVAESVKRKVCERHGIQYPFQESEYHLEAEQDIINYHRWIRNGYNDCEQDEDLEYLPSFSVVIPVYNVSDEHLKECIESVLAQTYSNYELILVDDLSTWSNVRPCLMRYDNNKNIKIILRNQNGGISEATNTGINVATGEYVAFMDCDDTIEPFALYCMAKKLNENRSYDFVYSDEDKITEDGRIRHLPVFKPEWSPSLFLDIMYTNHLAVYRTSIVKKIGGLRTSYNGAQDYDFSLRFIESIDFKNVGHVSKILYHWRERKESIAYAMNAKKYAIDAVKNAKLDYLRRNHIKGDVESILGMYQYRINYYPQGELVSIIIPSKDNYEVLKQCVESITKYTLYKKYEILIIDNGSNSLNKERIESLACKYDCKYFYEKEDFNFSRMCNKGARAAEGDYLLFLNDDIEIIQPNWMERMLGQARQNYTGAVGAKLFYPNTTLIQHCGVSQFEYGPVHNLLRKNDAVNHSNSYSNWFILNCSAVTGACLMVSADKFWNVGAFDEELPIAYNDVDLCYRLEDAGYYNVQRNDVVAYHHESVSRGQDGMDVEKLMRLGRDYTRLLKKSRQEVLTDNYFNKNITGYTSDIRYKNAFDKYEKVTCLEQGIVIDGILNVDSIVGINDVVISGWTKLESISPSDIENRRLILQDIYGTSYLINLEDVERQDVVDYLNDEKYRYSGFQCILDNDIFRFDYMRYRVGINLFANGKSHIVWGNYTERIGHMNAFHHWLPYKQLKNTEMKNIVDKLIKWSIDEFRYYDEYSCYAIRGYAFVASNPNYAFERKIMLVGTNDSTMTFDTNAEDRIDVMLAYPEEHHLVDAGFACWVYKDLLDENESYTLWIELGNKFSGEKHMVNTGLEIKG
ncbi:MAG: glycosyltransferase [Lachnospiraceae bacterium]|nr:glycosyltransferase [Lachnospiraceae bacterium]